MFGFLDSKIIVLRRSDVQLMHTHVADPLSVVLFCFDFYLLKYSGYKMLVFALCQILNFCASWDIACCLTPPNTLCSLAGPAPPQAPC